MRLKIFACFLVVLAVTGVASADVSPTLLRGAVSGNYDDNDCNNLNPGETMTLEMTGQFVFGKAWRGTITTTLHRGCDATYAPGPWDTEASFHGVGLGRSSTASGTCFVISIDDEAPSNIVFGVGGNAPFAARLDCRGAVTTASGTGPTGTFPIEITGISYYVFDMCDAGFSLCGDGPQDHSGAILGLFFKA